MSLHEGTSCVYDPLIAFMDHFTDASQATQVTRDTSGLTVEEQLKRRIIDGDRIGLDSDIALALRSHDALAIINDILLDGMKTVGELFGSGQMQLPFVLQSAETMKSAVALLEPHMDKVDHAAKGTIVLATVKGDVHDIGKNLVDIILSNNGYRVINLGIKVPIEQILTIANEQHADAIGMSGLLVKSTLIMKENLELMQRRGIDIPVVLGGAALTRRFVEDDLRPLYPGPLHFARDAFGGLRFMEEIARGRLYPDGTDHTKPDTPRTATERVSAPGEEEIQDRTNVVNSPDKIERPNTDEEALAGKEAKRAAKDAPGGAAMESSLHLRETQRQQAEGQRAFESNRSGRPAFRVRSNITRNAPVPTPPFFGSKIVPDVAIEKVYEYINEVALVRGQWQFRRGKRSEDEYRHELETVVRPRLEELKLRLKRERVLRPNLVYGYFPCRSDGNDLIIYRPSDLNDEALHVPWPRTDYAPGELTEWLRFSFPRQSGDRYLCIADFFRPVDEAAIDVCAFHIVTMGAFASEYTAELFARNKYEDYLYTHGLSVESAEALAEYWHKSIRIELGIDGADAKDIRRLFSQGYQGSRYSFGYPACPNLEDQSRLFTLLEPERIDITLTEEYQLVPEQSTSAIIVHHPEAKYFNIK
ncbi:MAG: B12-binding domain-containing protein [Bacteroidetes bacterium]|nr:B12-binding domain-containing protein [Bacteroidota bacterium]